MRVEKLVDIQEYFHSGKAGSCPKCGRGEGVWEQARMIVVMREGVRGQVRRIVVMREGHRATRLSLAHHFQL